jgi:hypothetical protein
LALKAVNMTNKSAAGVRALLLLALIVCFLWLGGLTAQTTPLQAVFGVGDASKLLRQINDGLVNGKAGKFLSAFDVARMSDGQLFKQQVMSFFSHTDSIRIHFNLTEATMNGDKGAATVEAEMEADPRDGNTPPLHKQTTLHLLAEHTVAGWKFTDVQPRSFFSTSSGAGSSAEPPSLR